MTQLISEGQMSMDELIDSLQRAKDKWEVHSISAIEQAFRETMNLNKNTNTCFEVTITLRTHRHVA